ncbi:MAG: DUF2100 domain-containing protein [Euryarchaeota archaeon]|jgi:hypothetical protein|uniref:DUF2100 domain-containing protein n=1 Tax=Methanobacterium sp. MZD130B TaxID=3394378 RepID=UPI00177A09E1|nr:DUF2100 domain-containing protein [Euryarchaeota archaeon]HHT18886.1 DUF2100 domain-containing protein [Methanobacterium sp.]
MHRNRIKQAQSLLKKAGKSSKIQEKLKNPKEGKIDTAIYEEILNKIIKTEEFIYTSRPSHHLLQDDAEEFCNDLIEIRNKIDEILAEFGVLEKENVEEKVKNLSKRYIFLTTKGNFKKLLARWGVEPQRIVVAGVPLEAEDMRIINPNIPESAFEPIKKKISHVKNDINRKMKDLDCENILVVVEKDKSGELLVKRANNIYKAFAIKKDKLKDVDAVEFKQSLEQLSLS